MRSIYLNIEKLDNHIVLDDRSKLHHFNNVLKIKNDEEVLVLNGQGRKRIYCVKNINKSKLELDSKEQQIFESRSYDLSVMICLTKKDDLSSIIKSCVEIGSREIILTTSEFSQKYKLNQERLNRIIIAAMEQSNNSIKPTLEICESMNKVSFKIYEKIFMLDPYMEETEVLPFKGKTLMMIGPEGGFSRREIEFMQKEHCVSFVKFDTPILRAKTAIAVGFGRLYSCLKL